jgi:hypothetical protein
VKRWDLSSRRWKASAKRLDGMSPAAFLELVSHRMPVVESRWMMTPRFYGWVERMLSSEMGRAGRGGRPAYLACATLADLLDVTPEKIADLLHNFRRPRRRS